MPLNKDSFIHASLPHDTGPVGLYVHIPFCVSRCTYCAFVSNPRDPQWERRYVELVVRELDLLSDSLDLEHLGRPLELDTIYMGGGTPSAIPVRLLIFVLDAVRSVFQVVPDAEVTVEVNPATADRGALSELRGAGFNRVSLGIQSFDDDELLAMGRAHCAGDAVKAFRDLREAGFANISVDLMAGWPGQTLQGVDTNLKRALELGPDHLSIYLLEVKEGTGLAQGIERGEIPPPDDDLAAGMYESICAGVDAAGYEHYEISNFARQGYECRHNLKYWCDQVFIGVGAGAHGMTGRVRYGNLEALSDYEAAVQEGRRPVSWVTELSPEVRFKDALIMGLRLVQGVDLDALGRRYGIDAAGYVLQTAGDLVEAGLMRVDGPRARLMHRGRLLSNQVFSRWV